jgi:hypothetical protein
VFTARYGLSHYVKQTRLVFKGLMFVFVLRPDVQCNVIMKPACLWHRFIICRLLYFIFVLESKDWGMCTLYCRI